MNMKTLLLSTFIIVLITLIINSSLSVFKTREECEYWITKSILEIEKNTCIVKYYEDQIKSIQKEDSLKTILFKKMIENAR